MARRTQSSCHARSIVCARRWYSSLLHSIISSSRLCRQCVYSPDEDCSHWRVYSMNETELNWVTACSSPPSVLTSVCSLPIPIRLAIPTGLTFFSLYFDSMIRSPENHFSWQHQRRCSEGARQSHVWRRRAAHKHSVSTDMQPTDWSSLAEQSFFRLDYLPYTRMYEFHKNNLVSFFETCSSRNLFLFFWQCPLGSLTHTHTRWIHQ